MEHKAKLIIIGSWTGLAYLVDGVWYVSPQSITESMGMDWVTVRKKLVARYADDIRLVKKSSGMGQWKPVLMPLDVAVQWLAGFAGNNHMAGGKRIVAQQMASAIARQFAAMTVEKGDNAVADEIVLLGGCDDQ